jgi:5'(3')-deoxyribonucleotidase
MRSLPNPHQPIAIVDVDDTVAGLLPEWLRLYNRDWDDTMRPEQVTSWMISEHVKPACGLRILDYLDTCALYDGVEPIVGALAGVERIRAAGVRVVFATTSVRGHAGAKLDWLQRHGFLRAGQKRDADYVEIADKGLLRGQVIIDDGWHNIAAWRGILALLFPSPQNAARVVDEPGVLRVRDWQDAADLTIAQCRCPETRVTRRRFDPDTYFPTEDHAA